MLSHSQRNLTLVSPTKCNLQLKFASTPDDSARSKQFFTKDKEAMFEEIQQLKQCNNQQQIIMKKLQSQLLYYKKEACTIGKDEGSPLKSSRLKHVYLEKITTLEEENSRLQSQISELQMQISQLKNPICRKNLDIYCFQLEEDNRNLLQLVEEIQQVNSNLKKSSDKLNIKFNALQIQHNRVKELNNQLLFEINDLKKKQRTFESRASCREIQRMDDKTIIELEQAKIDVRKYQQLIKQLETQLANQAMQEKEKIDSLQRRNKELNNNIQQLELLYEQEKSQYQSLQQSQRFLRRTVILKSISQEEVEQQQIETEMRLKKSSKIEKGDICIIARKIKLALIAQKVSLSQAEGFLVNNEEVTLEQLEQNLKNRIFGLKNEYEITQMAEYLADLEENEQFVAASRLKSIFRNLMEKYIILTHEDLSKINTSIANKRQEINQQLASKYPSALTDGFLSIELYIELLHNIDIQLKKNETDHLIALLSNQNKSQSIFLQQIFSPFDCNTAQVSDDEEEAEDQVAIQLENPMSVSADGEIDSSLEIKMCNSQELKKKSQSEFS